MVRIVSQFEVRDDVPGKECITWASLECITQACPQISIVRDKILLGRNKHCDVQFLNDPSTVKNIQFISGKHCTIHQEDKNIWIEDSSTNGTYLNGNKLTKFKRHILKDGDEIGIIQQKDPNLNLIFKFKESKDEEGNSVGVEDYSEDEHNTLEFSSDADAPPDDAGSEPEPKKAKLTREAETESGKEPRSAETEAESGEPGAAPASGDAGGRPEVQPEVAEVAAKDALDECLVCTICQDIFHDCVSLQPCMHSFCAGCYSDWMAQSNECPTCRTKVERINKNHIVNNLVEAYVKKYPDKKRSDDDVADLDAKNKITKDMLYPKRRRADYDVEDDDSLQDSDTGSDYSEDDDVPVYCYTAPGVIHPPGIRRPICRQCLGGSLNPLPGGSLVGAAGNQPLSGAGPPPTPGASSTADKPPTAGASAADEPSTSGASTTNQPPAYGASTADTPPTAGACTANQPSTTGASTADTPPTAGACTANQPSTSGASTADTPPTAGASTADKPSTSAASTANQPPASGSSTTDKPSTSGACTANQTSTSGASTADKPSTSGASASTEDGAPPAIVAPDFHCPAVAPRHIMCNCCWKPFPDRWTPTPQPIRGHNPPAPSPPGLQRPNCTVCQRVFCHMYWGCEKPQCNGCLNKFKHMNFGDKVYEHLIQRNKVESDIIKTFLVSRGRTWRHLVSDVMAKLDSGQYTCEGRDGLPGNERVTSDTVLCYACGLVRLTDLAYQWRAALDPASLPSWVTRRTDCYWGKNCRTQGKITHAQNFNHICPQTRFA